MGKRTGGLLCVLLLALLPAGCQFIRIEEGERTPLEYTIVKQEEIPEEISELMEQKKKKVFQMTYQVGDIRYLMKGYGEQLTGGYLPQMTESIFWIRAKHLMKIFSSFWSSPVS